MQWVIFSTGNAGKFLTAMHACGRYGIQLTQREADIPEIQEEDPRKVAVDKAAKAYALAQQPVVISDDAWAFSGLRGFPGVYMHSMNVWFTPEDFLRLVLPLADRSVVLTQHLVYDDGQQQKIFTRHTEGELLREIRGHSNHPSHTIISLHGDNGLSIAEAYEKAADKSARTSAQIWHDFAQWFSGTSASPPGV